MTHAEGTLPNFRINTDPSVLRGWREIFLKQKTITYKKGQVIVAQGEFDPKLYYILSGLVEYTYIDERGGDALLEVLGEGTVINLQPIFGKNAAAGSFSALVDCKLTWIPQQEVLSRIAADSGLALELIEELAIIAGGLVRQLHIHSAGAGDRVTQVLYLLADNYRRRAKDNHICIGISQGDLARITRTTRVTTTKILGTLKQKGVIDTIYGGIIVADFDRLRELVQTSE